MRYISERDTIKKAIRSFISTHSSNKYGWKKAADILQGFDPETVTKKEVDDTIGNTSWTRHRCSECDSSTSDAFHLGEEPYYESRTAYLCMDCMRKAVNLFKSVEK